MKIFFKNKRDWLRLKEPYIGASVIHNLFPKDLETFKKFYDDFREKRPAIVNERMEWGLMLEDIIAKEFSKRMNLKLIKPKWFYVEDTNKQISATPDRITEDEKLIVEIKNSQYFKNEILGIPFKYYCQIQAQMLCSGIQEAYLVVLRNGNSLNHYHFTFDEEFGNKLIRYANLFIRAVDMNDPIYYYDIYEVEEVIKKRQEDIEINEDIINRYIELNELKNQIENEINEIKELIKNQNITQETNLFNKIIVIPTARQTIDYKQLIQDNNLENILDKYKKQTTYLTIKIIGGKNE